MDDSKPLITTTSAPGGQNRKSLFSHIEVSTFLFALYLGTSISLDAQFVLHRVMEEFGNATNGTNHSDPGTNHTNPGTNPGMATVDGVTSTWIMYMSMAALVPCCFVVTTLPSYSDTTVGGRKLCLLCPLAGFAVSTTLMLIVSLLKLPLYCTIIASVFRGSFGDVATFFSGMYAYLSESTCEENRSFRMVLIDVFLGVGILLAQICSGYIISGWGYQAGYACLLVVVLMNLGYVYSCLDNIARSDLKIPFFSTFHIKKSFKIFFSEHFRGEINSERRTTLTLCLLICSLMWMSIFCKDSVLTVYLMDTPFRMTSVSVGYFGACCQLIATVSNIVMSKFLHKKLGDEGILLVGTSSAVCFCLGLAFLDNAKSVFMVPFLGFGFMVAIPMARSMCSKLVQPEEEGAMFSVMSLFMSLSLIVGMSSTSFVYSETVSTWAPTVFVYLACFALISCILAVVLLVHKGRVHYTSLNSDES